METEAAEEAEEQTAGDYEESTATDADTRMDDAPGEDEDPDETTADDTQDTM